MAQDGGRATYRYVQVGDTISRGTIPLYLLTYASEQYLKQWRWSTFFKERLTFVGRARVDSHSRHDCLIITIAGRAAVARRRR